jgi:hypothetical protein
MSKNLFELLSKETKKALLIKTPEDINFNESTKSEALQVEIVLQLKELNAKLNAVHDEIWDLNQRRNE